MRKILMTAATLLALATPALAETDCHPTLAQYNKLEIGMTYRLRPINRVEPTPFATIRPPSVAEMNLPKPDLTAGVST
jgi:hypothetical protein